MKKGICMVSVSIIICLAMMNFVSGSDGKLSAEYIREVFSIVKYDNGESFAIDPETVTYSEGSFTRPGASEAVVSFVDENQPHAALYGELWLLSYDKKWTPVFMINQSDSITFETIDILNDGIYEVFYVAKRWITGGILLIGYSLTSWRGGEVKTIYNTSGTSYSYHDSWKMYGDEEPIIEHEIGFEDFDGDNIVELIDTELYGTYVKTGSGEDDWEIKYETTNSTTYRFLIDDKNNIFGVEEFFKTP